MFRLPRLRLDLNVGATLLMLHFWLLMLLMVLMRKHGQLLGHHGDVPRLLQVAHFDKPHYVFPNCCPSNRLHQAHQSPRQPLSL